MKKSYKFCKAFFICFSESYIFENQKLIYEKTILFSSFLLWICCKCTNSEHS